MRAIYIYTILLIMLFSLNMPAEENEIKVSFKSYGVDEVLLEGILKYNTDTPEAPVVVFSHPHPSGQGSMYVPSYKYLSSRLLGKGYSVLLFNFRGVGNSGGDFGEGENGDKDLRGAIKYALSNERIKPSALFLFGYSYGAGVALKVSLIDMRVNAAFLLGLPTFYFKDFQKSVNYNNKKFPIHILIGGMDIYSKDLKKHIDRFVLDTYHRVQLTRIPTADHSFSGVWNSIFDYAYKFFEKTKSKEIFKKPKKDEK